MKNLAFFLFLLVALLAIFLLYIYESTVYADLDALRLIPQKERLTELSLNDSLTLPQDIKAGDTVSFSFTIHNLEGVTTIYPYSVYVVTPRGTRILLDKDTASLTDNATATIQESYHFMSPTPITVYIALTDRDQTLHFALPSRK